MKRVCTQLYYVLLYIIPVCPCSLSILPSTAEIAVVTDLCGLIRSIRVVTSCSNILVRKPDYRCPYSYH
jgi:hypothetical protein